MAEDSDLEKTEAPTPHRVEKAREKGQVPRSRELTSILMLAVGTALLLLGGGTLAQQLGSMVAQGMEFDPLMISNDKQMLRQLGTLLQQAAIALFPVVFGLALVGWISPMLIGGFLFSPQSISFDLKKLNPISGFKRMFSVQALAELLKAVLKAGMVGGIVGGFLWHYWPQFFTLMTMPPLVALREALGLIGQCALLIVLGLVPMVAFDVFYQIWSNLKKLRMTKQELKEEFKEQEGDPHVKSRIRQQQRAAARRRMMSDVPKADVIITNPTHYAVALRYQEGRMSAPNVLAKGAGEIALRIREVGNEHRIPQLEAPPLARALYRHAEIGQQIPSTLYAAVAEVLAWVYQLKRWRLEGGQAPKKPENLPVPEALDFAGDTTPDA
ncbi:flagellar biosynthesis protein FlhB [Enterobacillus tribolii]|uniref:flagellar biosynthesis protein FlhB n=1 Tax=Enterobacillus tribolii TaxID=1487935 RepID=UPI000E1C9B60|nr:flagellar biosynthesis protein FlhB [Enterobacillus tribolii]MBW7984752.1 flagellar type III secretion system protein FlhB [Enterobacillus tribolii]